VSASSAAQGGSASTTGVERSPTRGVPGNGNRKRSLANQAAIDCFGQARGREGGFEFQQFDGRSL
jgi:hypothetical protein